MAKYTKADIELQQARLLSIFGPDPDQAKIDAFNDPARVAAENASFREMLVKARSGSTAANRERNQKKWRQNRARWDAWKRGETK